MKISIITVVYNNKELIAACIESVLSQSYQYLEYIIIDGGSTDGTIDIIKSYGSKISKFISEKDEGIYDAMNKGILLATGDVIGFLNSDDLYSHNNVVKSVMDIFKEKRIDSVFGDLIYVSKNDTQKIVRYWKSCPYKEGAFSRGWYPAHPTFFVRSDVYKNFGLFKLKYKIAADYELMLRFFEIYKISSEYLDQILVKMRLGGASNKNIMSVIRLNIESYMSWSDNNMHCPPLMFIHKFLSRFKQLCYRK